MSKKSGYLIFSSIMVFFFFFCFTGAHLAKEGNIVWSGKYVLTLLLMCLVCGILAGILLTKVLGLIKGSQCCKERPYKGPSKDTNECISEGNGHTTTAEQIDIVI